MFAQYCRLNLCIMDSNRTLLRACSKKLVRDHRFGRRARLLRHRYYRSMLAEHRDAQSLYYNIHHGNV